MGSLVPDVPGEVRKLRWMLSRLLPPRDFTCQTKNGLMTFNSQAGIVARRLYSRRQWSWDLIQRCQHLLRNERLIADGRDTNGVFINVGAHIGSVLIPMMRQCNFRQGLAFEPSPANYCYLQTNVAQNDLAERVQLFEMGLSCEERLAEFELSARNCGDNRVRAQAAECRQALYDEDRREVVQVRLGRLDEVISEQAIDLKPGSLLWVDVQGHEGQFFDGARKTIKTGIPVVTEFWPYGINRSGISGSEFGEIAASLFTDFYRFQNGRWLRQPIDGLNDLYAKYDGTKSSTDVILVRR